jgi:hypothetical protein
MAARARHSSSETRTAIVSVSTAAGFVVVMDIGVLLMVDNSRDENPQIDGASFRIENGVVGFHALDEPGEATTH